MQVASVNYMYKRCYQKIWLKIFKEMALFPIKREKNRPTTKSKMEHLTNHFNGYDNQLVIEEIQTEV